MRPKRNGAENTNRELRRIASLAVWSFGGAQFSTYIFSADITPEMLKLYRVTKVKVFVVVLVYVFNFDLLEFSAAILEKGLLYS